MVRCFANVGPRQLPQKRSPSGYIELEQGARSPCIDGTADLLPCSNQDSGKKCGAQEISSQGADLEGFEEFQGISEVPFHQAFHDASCPAQIIFCALGDTQGSLGTAHSDHLSNERAALEVAFQSPEPVPSRPANLPTSSADHHVKEYPPATSLFQKVQNVFLSTAKVLGLLVLIATIALCSPQPAMAARSMGRASGGGFSSSKSKSKSEKKSKKKAEKEAKKEAKERAKEKEEKEAREKAGKEAKEKAKEKAKKEAKEKEEEEAKEKAKKEAKKEAEKEARAKAKKEASEKAKKEAKEKAKKVAKEKAKKEAEKQGKREAQKWASEQSFQGSSGKSR